MNRVRAGGKSKDIEHKHLQYLLMGLWGGARGLSSHLDKSSVFLNEFDRNPFSPPPPTVESFKLFPPDSVVEADLPRLPSIIPEQPGMFCYEPAAQKAHI